MKYLISCGFLCLMTVAVTAQDYGDSQFKQKFNKADALVYDGDYMEALPLLEELYASDSMNANVNHLLGICYLMGKKDHTLAIKRLESATRNVAQAGLYEEGNWKEKRAPGITYYYLGKAYHFKNQFDRAVSNYYNYRSFIELDDVETYNQVRQQIQYAENAMELIKHPVGVKITNLGPSVNSKYPDYCPIVTADGRVLIFTSRREGGTGGAVDIDGNFFDDIYVSNRQPGGKWGNPKSIGSNINTAGHDAAIGLSPDGQLLFIYKDDNGDGNIYFSTKNGADWTKPQPMGSDINSSAWETHATINATQDLLIFVSNRSGGGYGGRDLWYCKKLPNGEWSLAQNMGSVVNSQFEEDSPFISADGKTLIFSSMGHTSMGGFDIFRSEFVDGVWTLPENIGYPINTSEDDVFFTLAPDGVTGYYSSAKDGGFGSTDLYTLRLEAKKSDAMAVARGNMKVPAMAYADIKAKITVTDAGGAAIGTYRPNQTTGFYVLILKPGETYTVKYQADGYEPVIKKLPIADDESYQEYEGVLELDDVVFGENILALENQTKKLEEEAAKVAQRAEEEKRLAAEAAEKAKQQAEADALAQQQTEEREKAEAIAEKNKEGAEKDLAAEEERAKKAELERRKAEARARFAAIQAQAAKDAEEKAATEGNVQEQGQENLEEEFAKAEEAAKAKAAEEARLKAEQEAKAQAEREAAELAAKQAADEAAKAKAIEEARLKAEQETKAQAEREAAELAAKQAADEAAKAKAIEEARLKAEQEAKAQAEREAAELAAKQAADEAAKAKAAEEARLKAEQEAKAQAEREAAELAARQAAEEAAKAKAVEEARLKAEEEAKAQAEREAAELAARQAAEEAAKAKAAEDARLKAEEEAQAQAEREAAELAAKQEQSEGAAKMAVVEAKRKELQQRIAELKEQQKAQEEAAKKAAAEAEENEIAVREMEASAEPVSTDAKAIEVKRQAMLAKIEELKKEKTGVQKQKVVDEKELKTASEKELAATKKQKELEEKSDQTKEEIEQLQKQLEVVENEVMQAKEEVQKAQSEVSVAKERVDADIAEEKRIANEEKKKVEEAAEASRKIKEAEEAEKQRLEQERLAKERFEEQKRKEAEKTKQELAQIEALAEQQRQVQVALAAEEQKRKEIEAAEADAYSQKEILTNAQTLEQLRKLNQQLIQDNLGLKKQLAELNKKLDIVLDRLGYDAGIEKVDIPEDPTLQNLQDGKHLILRNIFFDYNQATLRSNSKHELNKLYEFLKANPTVKIEVAGHTDSRGNDDYNMRLSKERAQAVVNYLVRNGISSKRLTAVGYGETRPIARNENSDLSDNPIGRQLNRRIEISLPKGGMKGVEVEEIDVPKEARIK